MCYRDLYEFAQTLDTPLQISSIRQKISELLPGRRATTIEIGLDSSLSLGFYVSHRNEDTLYYPNVRAGSAVIAICDSLPDDWKRFVELKELMHLFDDPLQSTSTAKDFEQLLAGLCDEVDPSKMSPQHRSEHECMWMAMSLMCPEKLRTELLQRREDGSVTDAEIAATLQIPETYIINLCGDRYKGNIQYLLDASK